MDYGPPNAFREKKIIEDGSSLPDLLLRLITISLPVLFLLFSLSCKQADKGSTSGNEPGTSVLPDSGKAMRKVRVLPYWVPSAQFAGYYVGKEKGIFRKYGMDVEILPFDPLTDVAEAIRNKETDFAMLWLVNALVLKNKGVDIVNFAQLSSRSSLMLITKKNSNISTIEDMNGKRAGIWIGYEMQPRALFKKYGVSVELVPIGSTNNLFLWDGVDILNANWFDEFHSIINSGIDEDEMNKFFFADYGLNFLEDGLYCLEELLVNEPELCIAFAQATLEGWKYAFDHQDETILIVERYAKMLNQPVNRAHQYWMLKCYRDLYIRQGSDTINTMLQQVDFEAVRQIMVENELIDSSYSYQDFFRSFNKLN